MNPITALRLYSRLNPLVRQLQENLRMKLSTNMIIQILGTTTQILNQVTPFVTSDKAKAGIAAAVGIAQTLSALFAHFSNPDGTPAEAAYVKPEKP